MTFWLISGCRKFEAFGVRRATVTACVILQFALGGVAAAHRQNAIPTTADRLIDEAGQAKTEGNAALAYALLHEAVRIAPDNSLARWQLGQVNVAGDWLSIEEAQRRAEADPRQARYREQRDALGDTSQGQLALARWCRRNKLDDEGRFHWASVLSVDPGNKEALRAVGMHWRDGVLMTPAQVKEAKIALNETKQASRRWAARVAAWMRALSDKNKEHSAAAVDEIRVVDDVGAIPAFEQVTLRGELSPTSKNRVPKELSLAFLGALKEMYGEEATYSLARYAVRSPFSEVRDEAINELRYRPLQDFVPMLLDNLAAPVRSAYRLVSDPDGSVHYLHSLYREGPFADWSYRSERSIYQPGMAGPIASNMLPITSQSNIVTTVPNAPTRTVSAAGAARSARSYEQEIVASEQRVAQSNQKTTALNERIIAVLTGVSDQSLGSEPRAWWSWWQDYTDYDRSAERPVYETQDSSSEYVAPPVQSVAVECFVRGTPVWTKIGQRPIESLAIGDLVLAQNVKTGEIRYKPVAGRTLRPAGPIVQIATCDEKVLATRGHPLWVDGVGWRMAKELEDGAVLQTLAGTGRIKSVRPAADAETYNLVVADFNTYFVGQSGILVHDNVPRRPTQAILPGILKK